MLNIRAIGDTPTTYTDETGQKCHESLLRAYQILEKVKYLLRVQVPHGVILELIEDFEDSSYLQRDAGER